MAKLGEFDPGFDRAEERVEVWRGMSALGERERRIVLLRFSMGLTQREIAEQVGISQMHVSRLLRRSLETMGETVGGEPGAVALRDPHPRSSSTSTAPSSTRTTTTPCRGTGPSVQNGLFVPVFRTHRAIGMGGDFLVAHSPARTGTPSTATTSARPRARCTWT